MQGSWLLSLHSLLSFPLPSHFLLPSSLPPPLPPLPTPSSPPHSSSSTRVAEQEEELQEQAKTMEQLTAKLRQYEKELGERDEVTIYSCYQYLSHSLCKLKVDLISSSSPPSPQLEVPPPPPPGISLEEAEELRSTIDRLEGEASELRAELAAQEDANKKLSMLEFFFDLCSLVLSLTALQGLADLLVFTTSKCDFTSPQISASTRCKCHCAIY